MTRLKSTDIRNIASCLAQYDRELESSTRQSLFGIACRSWGTTEREIRNRMRAFCIHVIPVTAGQGVITGFSSTIHAILKHMGFNVQTTDRTDVAGLSSAFENRADAVMMADDRRFVGINLRTHEVVDNAHATGRVFASALDLMSGGISDCEVLVMGCGPVGEAGAESLLNMGARVMLYDIHHDTAVSLRVKLVKKKRNDSRVRVLSGPLRSFSGYPYILEATTSKNTIPDGSIHKVVNVAAPGVPSGVSKIGREMLKDRMVHDKLELGVAAMAVKLVLSLEQRG